MKAAYKIETYRDALGDHRWRAKRTGRIIADSGEGYRTRAGMSKSLVRFLEGIQMANFEIV